MVARDVTMSPGCQTKLRQSVGDAESGSLSELISSRRSACGQIRTTSSRTAALRKNWDEVGLDDTRPLICTRDARGHCKKWSSQNTLDKNEGEEQCDPKEPMSMTVWKDTKWLCRCTNMFGRIPYVPLAWKCFSPSWKKATTRNCTNHQ